MPKIAMFLIIVMGIIGAGMWYGHTRYVEGVRVTKLAWDADRAGWQKALDQQKHDALALLVSAQADTDAANAKAAKVAVQQEKDYETYMAGSAALKSMLSARGLRYGAQEPAPARCGPSGGPAVPSAPAQTQPPASTVVQLPDALAARLRQHAAQADDVVNAYRRCVAAVNGGPDL
jgi:hypothetical protein